MERETEIPINLMEILHALSYGHIQETSFAPIKILTKTQNHLFNGFLDDSLSN